MSGPTLYAHTQNAADAMALGFRGTLNLRPMPGPMPAYLDGLAKLLALTLSFAIGLAVAGVSMRWM